MTITAEPTVTITADTKVASVLESDTCGRCGGSGHYSFNLMHGSTCYGCGGSGKKLTKRGAAARAFYRSLAHTPVAGLRAGDRVLSEGFSAGSFSQPSRWVTVESIQDNAAVAAEAGTYEAALAACGSCSVITDADKALAAAERGATLIPRPKGDWAVFEGTRVTSVSKSGEKCSSTGDRAVLAQINPAVKVAILKTVAEYQDTLTKAGKPRKGTRWAA